MDKSDVLRLMAPILTTTTTTTTFIQPFFFTKNNNACIFIRKIASVGGYGHKK